MKVFVFEAIKCHVFYWIFLYTCLLIGANQMRDIGERGHRDSYYENNTILIFFYKYKIYFISYTYNKIIVSFAILDK